LAFAVAISTNPDILLTDEILAVGDISFQKKCMEKMDEFNKMGKTIIIVSHSLGTITEFCKKALFLEHGHLVMIGNSSEVVNCYRET